MGQYYIIVNRDKRQYLHAHAFGEGLKYGEFTHSRGGTMTALAFLLASTEERPTDDPLFGAWAGDRIVVAGDYDKPGKFVPDDDAKAFVNTQEGHDNGYYSLYSVASELYEDISEAVRLAMNDV